MIEFRCFRCNELIIVPDQMAGTRGRCPNCHEPVVAPGTLPVPLGPPSPSYARLDVAHRAAPGADFSKAIKWGFGITLGIIACIVLVQLLLVGGCAILLMGAHEAAVDTLKDFEKNPMFDPPPTPAPPQRTYSHGQPPMATVSAIPPEPTPEEREQFERRDYIEGLVRSGIVAKIDMVGNTPRVHVYRGFEEQTERERTTVLSTIFTFYHVQDGAASLLIKEFGTGREIGTYSRTGFKKS
jgi:hypothetical protein